jgi:hypothetical protein
VTRAPSVRHGGFAPERREYDPLYDPVYHSTRVLIGFVQGLFKALPDGRYRWSEDPDKTEITVTGAYPLTASAINNRPAVVVVHGQTGYLNVAMNGMETVSAATGNMVHRDILGTTMVFNCVARTGPEASALAWFLASNIKALRTLLQRKGPFTRIGPEVTIGGESPPGALLQDAVDGGAVNVAVVVPVFIPHKWEVRNPAHQLDTINLIVEPSGDA